MGRVNTRRDPGGVRVRGAGTQLRVLPGVEVVLSGAI